MIEEQIYKFSLLTLWGAFILTLPFITWFVKDKSAGWGNFLLIWLLSVIVTGIIVFFLIKSPNQIMGLLDSFNWIK